MLDAVAFVPSAPALIPELAGPGSTDLDPIRDQVREVVAGLASHSRRWVALGAGEGGWRDLGAPGDLIGFGVRHQVRLVPRAQGEPDPLMPTSMLMAAWLREWVDGPSITPVVVDITGSEVPDVSTFDDSTGLLVVVDGATTLTPKAPGGFVPESIAAQEALNHAVAQADLGAIEQSAMAMESWGCPSLVWRAACAAVRSGDPWQVHVAAASAPLGVGYVTSLWTRSVGAGADNDAVERR